MAIAAKRMLEREGYAAEVVLGCRSGGRRIYHAWVECGGIVVVGDRPDLRDFRPFVDV